MSEGSAAVAAPLEPDQPDVVDEAVERAFAEGFNPPPPDTSTMVERVARAIDPNWEDADIITALAVIHHKPADEIRQVLWAAVEEKARRVIAAMRKPTEAMIEAGDRGDGGWWEDFTATGVWESMIAAALSETAAPVALMDRAQSAAVPE